MYNVNSSRFVQRVVYFKIPDGQAYTSLEWAEDGGTVLAEKYPNKAEFTPKHPLHFLILLHKFWYKLFLRLSKNDIFYN